MRIRDRFSVEPRRIEPNVTSCGENFGPLPRFHPSFTQYERQPFANRAVMWPRFMRRRAASRCVVPLKCSACKRTSAGLTSGIIVPWFTHSASLYFTIRISFRRNLLQPHSQSALIRDVSLSLSRPALQDAATPPPAHRLAFSTRLSNHLSFILPPGSSPSCRFLFQHFSVYRLTTASVRAARRGLQRVKGRRVAVRGWRDTRRETLPRARRAINNQINEKYFLPHARGGGSRASALECTYV